MPKIKKYHILFVLLLILNLGVAIYHLAHKEGWHVDEQYSYGHANSTTGAYLGKHIDSFRNDVQHELYDQWQDSKIFHDYLTVQKGEQFAFGSVYENMKMSVHPPLYFMLLHAVCSFTPDVFSPWQGGSINLIAFLFTLIVFYKLSRLFIKNEYLAMIPVFLWGFSEAGLSTVLFLRVYMLLVLFAVCLLYEVMLVLLENRLGKKRSCLIFLFTTLGVLTHYNFLVFDFFLACIGGLILMLRKEYKMMFSLSVVQIIGISMLFLFFSPALRVLFHSYDGATSVSILHTLLTKVNFDVIKSYLLYDNSHIFAIYVRTLLGISENYYEYMFWLVIFVGIILWYKKGQLPKGFWVLCLLFFLMAWYIHMFMPFMVGFLRYLMVVMPLATLILVIWFSCFFECFRMRLKWILFFWIAVVILVGGFLKWKNCTYSVYVSDETKRTLQIMEKHDVLVAGFPKTFFDAIYVYPLFNRVYLANISDNPNWSGELEKADYLMFFNQYAQDKNFLMVPRKLRIDDRIEDKLSYISTIRAGIVFFDVYKVNKDGENAYKN